MGHGLGAVYEGPGAGPVSRLDHCFDGDDRTEDVGDVGNRYQPGPVVEQVGIGVEQQLPVVIDGDYSYLRSRNLRQLLPRHNVGVVLKMGDNYLIARADVLAAPSLCNQVYGLGGAPGEDDVVGRWRPQEAGHGRSGALEGVSRSRRQGVGAAVDIGIFVLVEVDQTVDDNLRLLRCRRIVQPDELAPVDSFLQDGEVTAHGFDVEGGVCRHAGCRHAGSSEPAGDGVAIVDEVEGGGSGQAPVAPL